MNALTLRSSLTLSFLCSSLLSAATIVQPPIIRPHIDRGWYQENGEVVLPTTRTTLWASTPEFNFPPHRNWFIFDLSGISMPVGSAFLRLENPQATGYLSDDSTEAYVLHEVSIHIATILARLGGASVYLDLGDGPIFGSYQASASDNSSLLEIHLNQIAVAGINSHLGGLCAVGGEIATLDEADNQERLFCMYA